MNWLIPALIAPAIYTIVNFVDKYIVSKEVKDYRGMPIYGTIMGFFVGTFFWVINGFPILPLKDTLIIFATGAITIWAAAIYFKAISLEDASNLVIMLQSTPLFTLLFAFLLLGEKITATQFLGFFLILVAVILVSIEKGKTKMKLSEAFWLILLVNIMWAISVVIIKFAINANSFAEILSYESWGLAIGGALLYLIFPSTRKAFHHSMRTVRKKALIIMFANELVFVIAKAITFFAYSIGTASLVSVVGTTSVFFGILYGLLLTKIFPKFIKEDISRGNLLKKIVGALILFAGIYLVNYQ